MFDKKDKGFNIISIDAGKYILKAVGENNKRFSARSKVDETDDEIIGNENGTFILEVYNSVLLGSKKYLIGQNANTEDYDLTKEKLHHKLLMYLGISKLIEQDGNDVGLIVAIPATMFFNRQVKDRYKDFLISDISPTVKVNGLKRSFTIKEIRIAPETMGYIYRKPSDYRDKLIGVVNLGGLNANGLVYEDLKPVKGTEFTINAGGYILNNKIKHALKSEFGLNMQDYEIPYIIKNGVYIEGKESKDGNKIVENIKDDHIYEIMNEMKRKNWNISGLNIHFTGGESAILQDVIKNNIIHSEISKDGQWDDAYGLYNVGMMAYGDKKRQYAESH